MSRLVHPIPLLLAAVSGWLHRQQADAIAFLIEENRVKRGRRAH